MIYRAKLRVKVPDDRAATDRHREKVLRLVEKHGGKNGAPNARQHVVGIFTDKAAMRALLAIALLIGLLWPTLALADITGKPINGSGFGKRPQHSLAQQIAALG